MQLAWSSWKPFPDPRRGGSIEAPIGPGVYEVRRVANGDLVAFGHAGNVALALAALRKPAPRFRLFRSRDLVAEELEYRTCPAHSADQAKAIAAYLREQIHNYWRQVRAA
jgi:hypothetical protein